MATLKDIIVLGQSRFNSRILGSEASFSGTLNADNGIVIPSGRNISDGTNTFGLPASSGTIALTSDIPTISTNITTDSSDDTKTASPKAVKTYVDNIVGDIETLLASI